MRLNKYGQNVSLRDAVSDIISENLPHGTDDEAVVADAFSSSKAFTSMVDDILSEVDEHIAYNVDEFSREVTE